MLYLSMGTKSFSSHVALGAPFLMMPLFAAQCQQNEGTSGWLQKEVTVKSVVASVLFFAVLCRRGSTEMEEASRINRPVWKKKKKTSCYSLKAVAGWRAQTKLKSVLHNTIHPLFGELSSTEHQEPLAFTPMVQHEVLKVLCFANNHQIVKYLLCE